MTGGDDRVGRLALLDWPAEQPAPHLDDLRQPGWSGHEVLVVRRLSLVASPTAVPSAVREGVAAARAGADRPRRGTVPATADAVLLADRAELLACYLLALAGGRRTEWWWALLGPELPGPTLGAVVRRPGCPLAPVLARLAAWERLGELQPLIGPAEETDVVATLAAQHELWTAERDGDATPARAGTAGTVAVGRRGTRHPLAVLTRGPAFLTGLAELAQHLTGGRPAVPAARQPPETGDRDRTGSAVLPAPTSAAPSSPAPSDGDAEHAPGGPADGEPRVGTVGPRPRARRGTSPARAPQPAEGDAGERPPPEAADRGSLLPPLPGPRRSSGRSRTSPGQDDGGSGGAASGRASTAYAVPASGPSQPQDPDAPPTGSAEVPGWGRTSRTDGVLVSGVAGVLYLVNPLRDVDLAGFDLADAAPWDVLDAVAGLVTGRPPDPVWTLFEVLSGRSPDQPPAREVQERALRLVEHLHALLELRDDEPTLAELLAVRGTVHLDDTHLDVHFPLDAAQVPVRRRGLDVDPGWVPSLGRVIAFHYGGPS